MLYFRFLMFDFIKLLLNQSCCRCILCSSCHWSISSNCCCNYCSSSCCYSFPLISWYLGFSQLLDCLSATGLNTWWPDSATFWSISRVITLIGMIFPFLIKLDLKLSLSVVQLFKKLLNSFFFLIYFALELLNVIFITKLFLFSFKWSFPKLIFYFGLIILGCFKLSLKPVLVLF